MDALHNQYHQVQHRNMLIRSYLLGTLILILAFETSGQSNNVFLIEDEVLVQEYNSGDLDGLSILTCKHYKKNSTKSDELYSLLMTDILEEKTGKYSLIDKSMNLSQFCRWIDSLYYQSKPVSLNTDKLNIDIYSINKQTLSTLLNDISTLAKRYKIGFSDVNLQLFTNLPDFPSHLPEKPLYTYTHEIMPKQALVSKYNVTDTKVFVSNGKYFEEVQASPKALLKHVIKHNRDKL